MMEKKMPSKKPGVRACFVLGKDGAKLYGNRAAFASLAEWMEWLARSPSNGHFECHVLMDLEDDESKFGGKQPRNVWGLVQLKIGEKSAGENREISELTFMCLEEDELDQLAKNQESGVLPPDESSLD